MKYLYNGIALPALPELDEPYAVIFKTANGVYVCAQNSEQKTVSSDGTYWDLVGSTYYVLTDGVWETRFGQPSGSPVLWANYDVYDSTGTLYLSASDPIPYPVTESSGDGWALYNGVKVSNIDNTAWDKTTYPYVVLCDAEPLGHKAFYLYAFEAKENIYINTTNDFGLRFSAEVYRQEIIFDKLNSKWGNAWRKICDTSSQFITPFWSNFDLLNADGSVYLSASDPIPLDGMNVIEWNGDKTGLLYKPPYVILTPFVAVSNAIAVCKGEVYTDYDSQTDGLENWEVFDETGEYIVHAEVDMGVVTHLSTTPYWASLIAYTPATTEEPTKAITDPVSFSIGYQIGCRLRAQRGKKIVGYSYNGTVLPALPQWDKEKYPYAFIIGLSTGYQFIVCDNPITHKKPFNLSYYVVNLNGNGGSFDLENDEWVLWRMDEAVSKYYPVDDITFLWANHDVINETDGTTYLEASEPVPVYGGDS